MSTPSPTFAPKTEEEVSKLFKSLPAQFNTTEEYILAMEYKAQLLEEAYRSFGKTKTYFRLREQVILTCNAFGNEMIRKGKYSTALKFFKKAESLLLCKKRKTARELALKGITLNNLGCLFKKKKVLILANSQGRYYMALDYLKKALEIEQKTNSKGIAGTLINICVALSNIGQHVKAIRYVKEAELLLKTGNGQEASSHLQVLASLNCGIEYEYIGKYKKALDQYRKALKYAESENSSSKSGLIRKIKEYIDSITEKANSQSEDDQKIRFPKRLGKSTPVGIYPPPKFNK